MKYQYLLPLCLLLTECVQKLDAGRYEVADREYSSQNYSMQRHFSPQGTFEEKHVVDHCLLMEMSGNWVQDGGTLKLNYNEMRNRANCHDSLPAFAKDSAELKIPLRNVDKTSFESWLAASNGKPEKWIKWIRVD